MATISSPYGPVVSISFSWSETTPIPVDVIRLSISSVLAIPSRESRPGLLHFSYFFHAVQCDLLSALAGGC